MFNVNIFFGGIVYIATPGVPFLVHTVGYDSTLKEVASRICVGRCIEIESFKIYKIEGCNSSYDVYDGFDSKATCCSILAVVLWGWLPM
jgi:hypothetical protein